MPNDIDFYIGLNNDSEPLRHLLSSCNYAQLLETENPLTQQYTGRSIKRVDTYHHDTELRRIHVIYTSSQSPLAPILDFDSTLLMNYISADNLVSLYPSHVIASLGKRLNKGTKALEFYSKYDQRGFQFMPQILEEQHHGIYDWTKLFNSNMLMIPTNIKITPSMLDVSWILPFVPVDGTDQDCTDGFWFEEIDGFGAYYVLRPVLC